MTVTRARPPSARPSSSRPTKHAQALLDDTARLILTAQSQAKAAHWSTASFAVHKATDELAEALGSSGDQLVESLSGLLALRVSRGLVARPCFPQTSAMFRSSPRRTTAVDPDDAFRGLVDAMVWFLSSTFEKRLIGAAGGPDRTRISVLSVRDELVLALAKAQYVMSLR